MLTEQAQGLEQAIKTQYEDLGMGTEQALERMGQVRREALAVRAEAEGQVGKIIAQEKASDMGINLSKFKAVNAFNAGEIGFLDGADVGARVQAMERTVQLLTLSEEQGGVGPVLKGKMLQIALLHLHVADARRMLSNVQQSNQERWAEMRERRKEREEAEKKAAAETKARLQAEAERQRAQREKEENEQPPPPPQHTPTKRTMSSPYKASPNLNSKQQSHVRQLTPTIVLKDPSLVLSPGQKDGKAGSQIGSQLGSGGGTDSGDAGTGKRPGDVGPGMPDLSLRVYMYV